MAHTSFPGHALLQDRRNFPFFAALLAAALCMMSSLASGQPAGNFARECALHDVERVAELDRHRAAQDVAPDNLYAGFLAILRARETCDRDPAALASTRASYSTDAGDGASQGTQGALTVHHPLSPAPQASIRGAHASVSGPAQSTRRAAEYITRSRGRERRPLPFEQPAKFEFVIQATARRLASRCRRRCSTATN